MRREIRGINKPRLQPVVFSHLAGARAKIVHILGPMRQLDLPVRVAVNLDPMPRDQRVNKVDRRQLSRAKAQPILAPRKLVQRGIT